ncbi:major facilitator superfamily MFS_1 [Desulfitobacterium hafniense DCB-2]|uniref:Major facilitator superfamily MFS_1 n=2 Tax=root TaxID=1 RepID=B8FSX9_DESHD|nr:MFS transporter [Desulfitobacterium hafniense]ACL21995.1 major facilitator superfamily MFS_1 [Desulfitobacterium hafniense DCB-2]
MAPEKQLNPSYRWVILAINFIICAMAYAGLTMWGMASTDLASTFNITPVQASLGAALLMAGYAVGSYVEANLTSKVGYRGAGLLGLVLMTIGTIGIPMAGNYNLILLLRFLQGWGILWLVGVNSSVAWFPAKQRGLASGVIGGGLTLGIGCGGWVATVLMAAAGTWQGAFRIWGIILCVSTIIWALLMKEPPKGLYPEDAAHSVSSGPQKKINPFATAACWLCILILFFNCWQLIGFNSIVANYLKDVGFTAAQASTVVLLAGLIGVASTPIGGAISDRLVQKGWKPLKARAFTTAVPGFLVAAVATAIFPFLAQISFGVACLMALFVGWGVPVTNATSGALPMDLLQNEDAAGRMFGANILVGIGGGGILAPIIAAALAESMGWTACFMVLAAGAAAGTVISLILPRFKLEH